MDKLFRFITYVVVAVFASLLTMAFMIREDVTPAAKASKLDELSQLIDTVFIEDSDATALEDAAAEAMVAATGDRWSYYIPASQLQSYKENVNNSYVGIGVTITPSQDPAGFLITEVVPGGPAQEAGILVGDVLVEVAGQDCTDTSADNTKTLVVGEAGTTVDLVVLRDGERVSITAQRREVLVPVTTWVMLDSGYALIQISDFQARCFDETKAAIEEAMTRDAAGLIFDVRYNPGGYKHELVKLLDYILPEGDLFHSEYYTGETSTDTSDADHLEIPMAVLVNPDTYSAAEFFAAALREYHYAEITGEQTVGKGHFQETFELGDGSAAAISTGRYTTPNGVSLEGVGITPDHVVAVDETMYYDIYYGLLDPNEDPQVLAAVDALAGNQ